MIRRKFMKFAPKEHNDEKVKKNLEKHNVPTFEGTQPSKFGQFSSVAKDLAAKNRKNFVTPEGGHVASAEKTFSWQQKAIYGGGGGGGSQSSTSDPRNPYAVVQPKDNPYARRSQSSDPAATSNPYGGGSAAGNPYGGSAGGNPYGGSAAGDPYGGSSTSNPYGGSAAGNPYGGSSAGNPYDGSSGNPYGGSSAGNSYGVSRSNSSLGRSAGPSAQSGDTYGYSGTASKDPYSSTDEYSNSTYRSNGGGFGGAYESNAYPGKYNPSDSTVARPPHKAEFDEPDSFGVPLARTQTSQTTSSTAAARQELFGAAPRSSRKLSSFGEDDELNHTPDELDGPMAADPGLSRVRPGIVPEEEDELNYDPEELQQKQGTAPNFSQNYDLQARDDEEEDELNQLPSELSKREAPVASAPQGYRNYGELHEQHDEDDGPGYVTGDQLFSQEQDSEDEDVEYVKREIRQTKQETVESTRRALQIANEAETSGRNALGMLGDQGERLGNSAKTVQLGGVQARVADENADELMRLNRSIFIPNVSNPFNSRRRNQMKAAKIQGEQVYDQLERDELERLQRESEQRVSSGLNGSGSGYSETALRVRQRMNRDNPERKMYQFEADSDDDALEDEIDQNLDGMQDAAKRLHQLSLNIHGEVGSQNRRIEEMGGRVDDLDHRLHKSTAKMATIN